MNNVPNRRLAGLFALAGLMLVPLAVAESVDTKTETARSYIRETVDTVLVVLAKPDLDQEARISELEEIAYSRFHFPTIARLVLARNYKKFSRAQRVEFETQFKDYLSRSYGKRLDRYEQESVEIRGVRVEPRGDVTVMTRIVGGQADGIEMNYRLRDRDGDWKIIDVVIEGVSLVSNFRSQFKEIVNRDGPEGLLARLRDKNADFDIPTGKSEKS